MNQKWQWRHNVSKYIFQINAVLLNILFVKETWKIYHIKQHAIQHIKMISEIQLWSQE